MATFTFSEFLLRALSAGGRRVRLLRRFARHRRLLSAALLAVAAMLTVTALVPGDDGLEVVVAGRAIATGHALRASDLRVAVYPPDLVPDGSARSPGELIGEVPAAPLARGTPVTRPALRAASLLGAGSADVAMPIRLADGDAAGLLRAGAHLLVFATGDDGKSRVVADDAVVLALAQGSSGGVDGSGSAVVTVALDRETAGRMADVAGLGTLSFALLPDAEASLK